MNYLQQCITFLNSSDGFGDNWLEQYDFTDENKEEYEKEIIGKIDNCVNKVYQFFNFSIISGEFIDDENYINKIEDIKDVLSLIQSSIEIQDEQIQDNLVNSFLNLFAKPLNNSLRDIKYLYRWYERKFLINHTDVILFDVISKKENILNYSDLSTILRFNIKLTEIDRDLSVNKKLLSDLLIIRKELEISKVKNDYTQILSDKCCFLIRKILYRFKQDSQTSYLYAFDFQDKQLTLEDVNPGVFNEFDLMTKKHYSIDNLELDVSEINIIHEKKFTSKSLNYIDYHKLTKFYKDKNKNYTQVSNLLKEFTDKFKQDSACSKLSKFDKRALQIILNYLHNNKFSIYLEQENLDLNKVEKALSKITHLQLETGIKNYFPYLKTCNFIANLLENIFKKELKIDDYDKVSNLIGKLNYYLKEAYNGFEWCKDRNFMAFQLPKKESYLQELDHPIFLNSTFVLPINFEKTEIELKELSRTLGKFNTLLEVHQNMKVEKEIILNLKLDVEKSERKSIEILGVFSAIVLFTSGSLQIFSIDGMTTKDGLKFMLVFSYSIVLFVFLIWLISRDSLKSLTKIHKFFGVGLLIISIISFGYVLDYPKKALPKKSNAIETPKNQNLNQNKRELPELRQGK
jgi:hypothetical protein